MTSDHLILACTIIAALVGIVTAVQSTRKNAKEAAAADAAEKARIRGEAFSEGARSRDDEVALIKSQRDDARLNRDRLQRIVDDRRGRG